jgi:hypothetical protein
VANFSVRLVDRTTAKDAKLQGLVLKHLQALFTELFATTDDAATVAWGSGLKTDALVLHFVDDVAHSYVAQQLPGNEIHAEDGGFTRTQGSVTGSEFYKLANNADGTQSQVKATAMARLAFHEGMHNKTGLSNKDQHGKGGLGDSPPAHTLTQRDKDLMRPAMKKTNAQLL